MEPSSLALGDECGYIPSGADAAVIGLFVTRLKDSAVIAIPHEAADSKEQRHEAPTTSLEIPLVRFCLVRVPWKGLKEGSKLDRKDAVQFRAMPNMNRIAAVYFQGESESESPLN